MTPPQDPGPGSQLQPGDPAPDFTLPDADGRPVSLADLRGQRVVVYFYPRAATPGCTTQACDFRDALDELRDVGVAVLAVSPDPLDRLRRFRDEHRLPFPLLSDVEHEVMARYGAWGEKTMYGVRRTGVIRSTVVVAADGTVELAQYGVRAKGHVAKLRAELAATAP